MKQSGFLPPANEACEGYVFTRICHSVHRGRGAPGPHPVGRLRGLAGGSPGPHPRGRLRGLPQGVCRPTTGMGGGLQAHTRRGRDVSQHALRQTPLSRRLLRAVRILLECILVICHDFRLIPSFPVLFTLDISHILGVFHAPVSGLYLLSVYATTGNDAGYLFIKKNDEDICRTWITAGQSPADDVGHDKGTCTGITELTPGDSVRVTGNTDDPARIQGSDSGFIGHLIQPYC